MPPEESVAGRFYRLVEGHSEGLYRVEQALTVGSSALIFLGMAVKFDPPSAPFYTYSAFALVLVGVTLFDFRKHEIPLLVTLPGALAGLVLASLVLPLGFTRSIIGLAFGGGVLVATTLIEAARKKEVGGGDWKYAAMIGAFVGWPNIITVLILTGVFWGRRCDSPQAVRIPFQTSSTGPLVECWSFIHTLDSLVRPTHQRS